MPDGVRSRHVACELLIDAHETRGNVDQRVELQNTAERHEQAFHSVSLPFQMHGFVREVSACSRAE